MLTVALLSLTSLSLARVLERPDEHSHAWRKVQRSEPSSPINLVFALKQQNVAELRDLLLEVSTPSHERYGEHLTMAQALDMTRPSVESTSAVKDWLTAQGVAPADIRNATPNGDFLRVSTTIGFAEQLLSCVYFDYIHETHGDFHHLVSRVDHETDYAVPDHVADHLDFVSPTKRFPAPLRVNSTGAPGAGAVTPSFLRELYSVGSATGSAPNNIQADAQFLEQYYSEEDVQTFWQKYNIPATNLTNVPSDQSSGHGAEAELDVQYITAMGQRVATQSWYTPGRAPDNSQNEPFLTWLMDVESAANAPLLFSVSYGETEKSVGYSYASRINTELAKCGATGMTFLFSSGDSGAGGNCTASKGRECPNFPTGSPYVTSVGGTRDSSPETAWSNSGGGFSDYWPTQSWQADAVATYLSTAGSKLPAQDKFNATGRGYPDVSAQSVDFEIVLNGRTVGVSGTSCSSPTVGGIFGLLNDLRLQNNMAPLGFLNPFLYEAVGKDATLLNDVTEGQNIGCNGMAFPAVRGWDAVTGYGTPNYAKLAKVVLRTGAKTVRRHD